MSYSKDKKSCTRVKQMGSFKRLSFCKCAKCIKEKKHKKTITNEGPYKADKVFAETDERLAHHLQKMIEDKLFSPKDFDELVEAGLNQGVIVCWYKKYALLEKRKKQIEAAAKICKKLKEDPNYKTFAIINDEKILERKNTRVEKIVDELQEKIEAGFINPDKDLNEMVELGLDKEAVERWKEKYEYGTKYYRPFVSAFSVDGRKKRREMALDSKKEFKPTYNEEKILEEQKRFDNIKGPEPELSEKDKILFGAMHRGTREERKVLFDKWLDSHCKAEDMEKKATDLEIEKANKEIIEGAKIKKARALVKKMVDAGMLSEDNYEWQIKEIKNWSEDVLISFSKMIGAPAIKVVKAVGIQAPEPEPVHCKVKLSLSKIKENEKIEEGKIQKLIQGMIDVNLLSDTEAARKTQAKAMRDEFNLYSYKDWQKIIDQAIETIKTRDFRVGSDISNNNRQRKDKMWQDVKKSGWMISSSAPSFAPHSRNNDEKATKTEKTPDFMPELKRARKLLTIFDARYAKAKLSVLKTKVEMEKEERNYSGNAMHTDDAKLMNTTIKHLKARREYMIMGKVYNQEVNTLSEIDVKQISEEDLKKEMEQWSDGLEHNLLGVFGSEYNSGDKRWSDIRAELEQKGRDAFGPLTIKELDKALDKLKKDLKDE